MNDLLVAFEKCREALEPLDTHDIASVIANLVGAMIRSVPPRDREAAWRELRKNVDTVIRKQPNVRGVGRA